MTDPEREEFMHRVGELERAKRRWRVLAVSSTLMLLLLLILTGSLGTLLFSNMARQSRSLEAEWQRLANERARQEAARQLMPIKAGAADPPELKP